MGLSDWFRRSDRHGDAQPTVNVELASLDGAPELRYLIIDVPAFEILSGLNSWKWLQLRQVTVVAVSAFGEVFFRDAGGAIHQIDTIQGRLTRVADSLSHFRAMLQDADTRDQLLLARLVMDARQHGLLLAACECYDFRLPPVLGGQMSANVLTKLPFAVKNDLASQLHEKLKDVPMGT